MPTTQNNRITTDSDQSLIGMIQSLTGGNIGSMRVLMEWFNRDLFAVMSFLTSLDLKHLYDHHIWEVYKEVCGEDIDRFIYHVQMELPDQDTGIVAISGPYTADIDHAAFFAKRTFGTPGSYWALEHPPTDRNYAYPIR